MGKQQDEEELFVGAEQEQTTNEENVEATFAVKLKERLHDVVVGSFALLGTIIHAFVANVLFSQKERMGFSSPLDGYGRRRDTNNNQSKDKKNEPQKEQNKEQEKETNKNPEKETSVDKEKEQETEIINRAKSPILVKENIEHENPDELLEKYITDTKELYAKFDVELVNTGCDVTMIKIGNDKVYSIDNEDLLNNNTVTLAALFKEAGVESYNAKAVVLSVLSDSITNDTMSVSSNIGNTMNIICERNVIQVEVNGKSEKLVLNEEIPDLSNNNLDTMLNKLDELSKEVITYTIGDKNNSINIVDNGKTTKVDIVRNGNKIDMGEYNFNKGSAVKSFIDECYKQKVHLRLNDKWVDYKDLGFAVACISSGSVTVPNNRDIYSYRKRDEGEAHFVIKQNDLGKQVYSSVPNINGNSKPEFAFSVPSNPTTEEFVHIMEKSAEMRDLVKETEANKEYDSSVENNINDAFNKEYKFDEISIDRFNEIKEESLEVPEENIELDDDFVNSLAEMINSNTIIEEIDYDEGLSINLRDEEEIDL